MSKKNTLDIKKTGPQSFRQLQNANNDPFVAVRPKTVSQFDINDQVEQEVFSPLASTKTAWGESMFDNKSASADDFQNLQDIRAENQPWYAKAAAGIAKGAITAGTTFASGTLGLIYGIGSAIGNGELSKIWDNDITNTLAAINEKAEEWLPNYYTKEQEEGPWYSSANLLSANFLFDKVVKNIGFTVGAAYSGGIYSKIIGAAARGIGGAYSFLKTGKTIEEAMKLGGRAMEMSTATRYTKGLVGAGFSAMGEGAIEAINNSRDYVVNNKQKIDALSAEEYNTALHAYIDAGGKMDEKGNPVLGNDAVSVAFQDRVQKIQKAADAAYKQVDDTRAKMGNADFLANIPLLTAGNLLTFGKMWAGGWKAERNIQKTVTRATKEAQEAAKAEGKDAIKRLNEVVEKAKKTGYQGLTEEEKALVEEGTNHLLGPKMHAFAAASREPIKEGLEEMNQSAIAKSSDNYYSSRVDYIYDAALNGNSRNKVLSSWEAAVQGFADVYGDFNNYEEGFIGALTGLFGSPTFGKKNNSTSETYLGRSKWFGLSGGVIPQWRNAIKDREHEAEIVSHVNSILKSGNLERNMKYLIAQTTFDEDMKKAAIKGDKLDYKDSELASAFESIMYLKEAGKLDLLKNAINSIDSFTEEDAKKILEDTTSQVGIGVSSINLSEMNKREDKLYSQLNDLETKRKEVQQKIDDICAVTPPTGTVASGDGRNFRQFKDPKVQDTVRTLEDEVYSYSKEYSKVRRELDDLDDTIRNYNPITISPYLDINGELMSPEEVLNNLNEKKSRFNSILKSVENTIDSIDNATSNTLTNEQLKTLTWYKILQQDWKDRANSMGSTVSKSIKKLLENENINEAIKEIDDFIQGIEPAELNEQDRIIYGGLTFKKKYLQNLKENFNSVLEILQNLDKENENNSGLALSRLLANDKEITIGEGKNAKKVKVGDYLYDFLMNAVKNSDITEDDLKDFTTIFKDLKRIGSNYGRYNELLKDYINHPEKIDAAHRTSLDEAENNHKRDKLNSTNNNIRFDGTVGATAKDMRNNGAALDEEGLEGWFGTLTPEQQARAKEAGVLIKGVDALLTAAEGTENENIDKLLREVIENEIEGVNNIDELLEALRKKESYGEETDKILGNSIEDEVKNLDAKEELEAQFREFINSDEISKIAASLDAVERHNQEKQDKYLEEASKAMDGAEDKKDDDSLEQRTPKEKELKESKEKNTSPKSKREKNKTTLKDKKTKDKKKVTNKKTDEDNPAEKNSLNSDKAEVENQGSSRDIVARNGRRQKLGYSTAYSNRPQLSEVFMYGKDLQSYLNYIKEHPERIPKYTKSKLFPNITNQKEFNEAFIKYIEATHKYLTEQGAFDYVKHNLKHGDKLVFTIDKDLNEAAGVPVVIIKAIDSEGVSHVVGTMKTELDFMSINSRTDKSYGTTEQAQKALYDDIVKKYNALTEEEKSKEFIGNTSTVSTLMGGDIAFSNTESTVSSIFTGTGSKVIFGVVREENGSLVIRTGNSEQDKKVLDISNGKKGQVYVLIPANNGSLVPALCYGTPLLELLSKSDDWYINQIVKSIQDIIPKLQDTTGVNTLGAIKSEIAKWLGVNSDNLHINLAYKNAEGKEVQTTDLNKADRISIKYSLNNSDEKIISTILLEDDKSVSRQKALNVVTRIITEVAKSEDPELQVNLSFSQMSKDSTRDEYYDNMSKYYHTNIVQGQTHTVNDWFTYDKTDVEEEHRPSNSKRITIPTPTAPANKGSRPQRKVISKKTNKELEISEGGQVTDENGKTIVGEEKQEILDEERKNKKDKEKESEKTQEEPKSPIEETDSNKNGGTEETLGNSKDDKEGDNSDSPTEDSNDNKEGVHIDNNNKSLIGDMTLGQRRKRKAKSRKSSDVNNNDSNEESKNASDDTSSTSNNESQDTPYVRKRRTRSKKKESSESTTESSNNEEHITEDSSTTENSSDKKNTDRESETQSNNKRSVREEKAVEVARQIFGSNDATFSAVRNLIHKIFDYLENTKDSRFIKAITEGLNVFADNATSVLQKSIFNNFIATLLNDEENETLLREASKEFNNDTTEDDSNYIMESLKMYMQGYRNLKSKALSNIFQKISNVIEVFNKNKLLTQNFFNNLIASTKNGIDSMLQEHSNLLNVANYKYAYDNLSSTIKDYLNIHNISKQDYEALSPKEQESLVRCVI